MLLRQKPKSFDKLIKVTKEQNTTLQMNNYSPSYLWEGNFYYIKSNELLLILEKGGK